MMNIQKKSLQHVSDTLKSFNTSPIYIALIAANGIQLPEGGDFENENCQ